MKLVIAIPCLLRGGTEIQTLTLVRAVKMQSAKSELQTAKDEAQTRYLASVVPDTLH